MHTWTKADIKRMQSALDSVHALVNRSLNCSIGDEHRDRWNAYFSEHVHAFVRSYFHNVTPKHPSERRAYARIAALLLTEQLPPEIEIPQVVTHREVAASLKLQDEQEAARVAALNAKPEPIVYRPDHERDLRAIAFNLADLCERGVVEVHRATAEAFGTDTTWADLPGHVVRWQDWARPAAERRDVAEAWDRWTKVHYSEQGTNSEPLARLWAFACAEETLPAVLDLRGIPTSDGPGEVPLERWRDALTTAIRKASKGVVLIVDCEPWVLGRLLPGRVG